MLRLERCTNLRCTDITPVITKENNKIDKNVDFVRNSNSGVLSTRIFTFPY
jgi:hypothetical protein